jgi:hypothetical protein
MTTNLVSAIEEGSATSVYNAFLGSRDDAMTHVAANYQKVLKQAQRLPLRARRQLAETLLRPANADEQTILVSMSRFQQDAQARFQDLMDRNNEGQLTPGEREELKALVARYKTILLLNTEALLKANCPELFTPSGRLSRRRLDRSLRQQARNGKKRSSPK